MQSGVTTVPPRNANAQVTREEGAATSLQTQTCALKHCSSYTKPNRRMSPNSKASVMALSTATTHPAENISDEKAEAFGRCLCKLFIVQLVSLKTLLFQLPLTEFALSRTFCKLRSALAFFL